MSAITARELISMGLEVDSDADADGTLASAATLALIRSVELENGEPFIKLSLGLLEVLSSLSGAAIGAADIQTSMVNDPTSGQSDPDLDDNVARLTRFAAHIKAARLEIAPL